MKVTACQLGRYRPPLPILGRHLCREENRYLFVTAVGSARNVERQAAWGGKIKPTGRWSSHHSLVHSPFLRHKPPNVPESKVHSRSETADGPQGQARESAFPATTGTASEVCPLSRLRASAHCHSRQELRYTRIVMLAIVWPRTRRCGGDVSRIPCHGDDCVPSPPRGFASIPDQWCPVLRKCTESPDASGWGVFSPCDAAY